jgi:hypothetical protein
MVDRDLDPAPSQKLPLTLAIPPPTRGSNPTCVVIPVDSRWGRVTKNHVASPSDATATPNDTSPISSLVRIGATVDGSHPGEQLVFSPE